MFKLTYLLTLALVSFAKISHTATVDSNEPDFEGDVNYDGDPYWEVKIPDSIGQYQALGIVGKSDGKFTFQNYSWYQANQFDAVEHYETSNNGEYYEIELSNIAPNGLSGVSIRINGLANDDVDGQTATFVGQFEVYIGEIPAGEAYEATNIVKKAFYMINATAIGDDVNNVSGSMTTTDMPVPNSSAYAPVPASSGAIFSGSAVPYSGSAYPVGPTGVPMASVSGSVASATDGVSTVGFDVTGTVSAKNSSTTTDVSRTARTASASSSVSSDIIVVVATESPSTTVITTTSCSDNGCFKTTATTGIAVYTSVSNGVEVVYTTYCPLTGLKEHTSSENQPKSASLTNSEIVSETASTSTTVPTGLQSVVSYSSAVPTVASLSTYSGLAPSVVPLSGALCGSVAFLLTLFA